MPPFVSPLREIVLPHPMLRESPPRPRRLLLVDDDATVHRLVRLLLRQDERGDLVLAGEAFDGREGIEVAGICSPDLVLLDIQMPVMDGLQALPALRSAAPSARIVMYSAISEKWCEAIERGADGWITKGADWAATRAVLLGETDASVPAR